MNYQRHGRSVGPPSDTVAIFNNCVAVLSDFVALPIIHVRIISDSDFVPLLSDFVAIISDLVALPSDSVAIFNYSVAS
jgi:hypothetical protein